MYCLTCGEELALLGMLIKDTKHEQHLCSKCNCIWLKTKKGHVFKKVYKETTSEKIGWLLIWISVSLLTVIGFFLLINQWIGI